MKKGRKRKQVEIRNTSRLQDRFGIKPRPQPVDTPMPEMLLSDFDFELPRDLIASHPLAQRDASRMLVMDAEGNISDKHIRDFLDYLQPGDVVVFNNSRVIPARFMASGHEITLHTALANDTWWGLCRKFKKFERGQILTLDDGTEIEVLSTNRDSGVKIKFHCDDVFGVLQRVGKLPLPPYMHREQEDSDQERYQTVYAEPLGSMAAPTAGLHFTDELMQEIENRGAKVLKVTLHVGAGTWMPVKTENVNDHKMHSEWGEITQAQAEIINSAARVIAVGTTSLRLLESAAQMARHLRSGTRVVPYSRRTNIFIRPGYRMRAVDVLLTNFHLPKSTLFMLVSAFSGLDQIKNAYAHAISEQYRFFSYGDCCLLFRRAYQIQRRTGAHVEPDVPDSDETMSEPDNIMEQHTSDEQLISE